MSTIGSLLALASDPGITPWNDIVKSSTQAQTGLRTLADLKQKQASEAFLMERIQNDPELRQRLFGDSILGSLGTAPGGSPGAPGPITQSPLGGGPSQQIPASPDASRYANVPPTGGGPIPPNVMGQTMPTVTPPQGTPTLATIGPQGGMPGPQGPMQAPQNPLLEMARRDPRAAMMLQQQLQARQEQQWKTEERRLDMGVKIAESVAQELGAVRNQGDLDVSRERIRQYHPQAAAQIPQFYSKEALEPLIMKGVAVKDLALWRKNMAQAKHTDMMTEQLPATFKALEQFGTGGGAQAPTGEAAPTGAAPTTGTQARTAPPEFESAVTEANRLYPQVSTTRIKSIIAAESSYDPKAVSSKGAKGPMGLMDDTAREMGVKDSFNVQENVRGGTRYYAQLLTKYGGDERKALTAYNWGMGNFAKAGDDVTKAPPETQAYVNRVLGGGGAGPAGGTTGTAQAPPTDPRIAQLRARIEQGNKAARQAELSGMEGPARQVRAEVNDLQQELVRLDAPRQEFLKKQAVHGLELEQQQQQGAAAARLKADTEPASKEEIDAVNRAQPPDKRVPYGTTRKALREQGRVGGELLSPAITTELTATTRAIQDFEALSTAAIALPTGPLTQYVETFKERWGIDISDEKVAQRAILAGATNQLLKARSGGAITDGEHARLLNELPNEGNDPKVFKARLANTLRQFKNDYKTKVQILRKTGHAIPDDLMEPLAAPEAPPAPKVSSTVDKARDIMKPR